MEINVGKRQIGVNFNGDKKAGVCLWAPFERQPSISIAGKVTLPLLKSNFGYWTLSTEQLSAGDTYHFVLGNEKNLADPASLSQPYGVHGPSAAIDLKDFEWTDADWQNPSLESYIFYELHAGTFSENGDFEGIIKKLDHLVDLGITAIELLPITQFPGERNWGYDGVFPFAVQNNYGGANALQRLVNICHNKGLAVVLDVVYNHLGPEGNYLGEFGPYFTDKYKTPWGAAINYDDAWCDAVRHYFIENALMWFRDFHIDGLRMDAVHTIADFSPKHILREIKEYANQLFALTGRPNYLIVECDLNDTVFIKPVENDGFGMNAQFADEFHHALRVTAGQKRESYYSDFTGIKDLAKAYKDAFVFDGQYSARRLKKFGVKTTYNTGAQFVVFSQNHDQVGNRMLGERTSRLVSFEMQKLMAAAVMVSPYLPLLFMGEEYSEPNPFLYFINHSNEALIRMVQEGRKRDFEAEGDTPDPQCTETFSVSKLQWDLLTEKPHACMLQYYKELISIRKLQPSLKALDRKLLNVSCNEADNTLMLHRWSDKQSMLCLMNFSGDERTISLQEDFQHWQKLFDSADHQWNGPGASAATYPHSAITLHPESIVIYIKSNV
jgi:maltooligosyltrehalose trehalohydrolase